MLGKYFPRDFLEIMGGKSLTEPPICFVREKTRKGATESKSWQYVFLMLEMLACFHFYKVLIAATPIYTGSHFGPIC